MILQIIYAAVILAATTLGAFVGLGGGVIIKPVLDFIGKDPRFVVDFLSAVAVFTMSVVSTYRAIKRKQKFEKRIVCFISLGSIAGGWLGSFVMSIINNYIDDSIIRTIQAICLAVLLSLTAIYVSKCNFAFEVKNSFLIIFCGLILGFTASFLGIGGGPINVAVLTLLFSFEVKESAVYSIAIIFFSQLSKLITLFVSNGISTYLPQWKSLLFILPAAVLGGIIGSRFNRKFSNDTIKKVFSVCMILLVLLNVYNAFNYLGILSK